MQPSEWHRMQPSEWHVIALDVTRDYNLAEEDREAIVAIFDVFYYDATSHTYLCELTPSYDLRYLFTYAVCGADVDDDTRERIDERYCHEPTEDTYMHVASVERLIEAHPDRHAARGAFGETFTRAFLCSLQSEKGVRVEMSKVSAAHQARLARRKLFSAAKAYADAVRSDDTDADRWAHCVAVCEDELMLAARLFTARNSG